MTNVITGNEFITEELKKYDLADATIEQLAKDYLGLTISGVEDKEGYEKVKEAWLKTRGYRTSVEKKRTELKANALEYGRKVDGEAKRITLLLAPIEDNLVKKKEAIDNEAERIKKEEAAKKQLSNRIEKLASIGLTAPGEELLAMDDVEFFTYFNEKYDAHLEEKRQKLEKEQNKVDEEKVKAKRAEEIRKAEEGAAEQAIKDEREKQELERQNNEKLKREAEEERLREAAAAPEKEKLAAFVKALDDLHCPDMDTQKGTDIMSDALTLIAKVKIYVTTKADKL